jgi:hypothetical protein
MKIPVILYDIVNKKLTKNIISKSNCFYFYAHQLFSVKIISGVGLLYSVKQIGTILETQNGLEFSGNYGYTLYIPKNNEEVVIEISSELFKTEYKIKLVLDNIIDETNEHYLDLITNNHLPNYEQLKPALLNEFKDDDLLKRLLLDFKNILKYKGTKESINKFFQFIGYSKDGLTIQDEYFNKLHNSVTTEPNKLIDTKTGNYHILYDNFIQEGFDENNLPIRTLVVQDLEKFFQHLIYAISLANTYFTLKEQDITFFGINYSSNIPKEPSITSHMNVLIDNDVHTFRKSLYIDFWTHVDSSNIVKHVSNCIFKDGVLYRTETKVYKEVSEIFENQVLYFIDQEIFDDTNIDDYDLDKIKRIFGVAGHLKIHSPNTYIEFEFVDINSPSNKLVFNKQLVADFIYVQFAIASTSTYRLTIKVTDLYNNTEKYFYEFHTSNEVQRIDFDVFSSILVSDDMMEINSIDSDIDSPSLIIEPHQNLPNYILPFDKIPFDLADYYSVPIDNFTRWLTLTEQYILPGINQNRSLDIITETIPLDYIDTFLDILTFEYSDDWELKLRVYDFETYREILINVSDIVNYPYLELLNRLYITLMDITDIETLEVKPYYFITTNEVGIDLTKQTYDFVLVSKITNEEKSVYSLALNVDLMRKKIPVNYDFPLFPIVSELVPDFETFISPAKKYEIISDDSLIEYPIVQSIFPRLISTESVLANTYYLKIGDVILCRLTEKYVVGETDILWKVFNAFTDELLFQTTDMMLKYRVKENTIYNIQCTFKIADHTNQLIKRSIFSSFEKQYFD